MQRYLKSIQALVVTALLCFVPAPGSACRKLRDALQEFRLDRMLGAIEEAMTNDDGRLESLIDSGSPLDENVTVLAPDNGSWRSFRSSSAHLDGTDINEILDNHFIFTYLDTPSLISSTPPGAIVTLNSWNEILLFRHDGNGTIQVSSASMAYELDNRNELAIFKSSDIKLCIGIMHIISGVLAPEEYFTATLDDTGDGRFSKPLPNPIGGSQGKLSAATRSPSGQLPDDSQPPSGRSRLGLFNGLGVVLGVVLLCTLASCAVAARVMCCKGRQAAKIAREMELSGRRVSWEALLAAPMSQAYSDTSPWDYQSLGSPTDFVGTYVQNCSDVRAQHISEVWCPFKELETADACPDSSHSALLGAPDADASTHDRREHLDRQLDSLTGLTVLDTLSVLPGDANRLHGGQAVVQVVEDNSTRLQYAIKFFLTTSAFQKEKSMYLDSSQPLGACLPQLRAIVDASRSKGGILDRFGRALPSCIVMEKGDALDLWTSSGKAMDTVTGLQVLSHIAKMLGDVHASGYVHRDIKPGNVMWLPLKQRWTLTGLGCVARTGTVAPTGFTLAYAAPEVLRANSSGYGGMHVTEALDAWSVGVLALELISAQPVFNPGQSQEQTVAMILGQQQAPWEAPETAPALLKHLRHFKKPVLALLKRDPLKRPGMKELWNWCQLCLSQTTAAT